MQLGNINLLLGSSAESLLLLIHCFYGLAGRITQFLHLSRLYMGLNPQLYMGLNPQAPPTRDVQSVSQSQWEYRPLSIPANVSLTCSTDGENTKLAIYRTSPYRCTKPQYV
ncbi:hypothetical protein GDO86_016513 [Hymenochirus boettgeri]|uniref:Uncharacterized protein n=1 Tax=Hymenochirus boettgeri TaxID=247094 RepID=A0A8T2K5N8_9PIPI|nr:hypothetical protein GDO86_016513 [Hymenochirus boettgeri]